MSEYNHDTYEGSEQSLASEKSGTAEPGNRRERQELERKPTDAGGSRQPDADKSSSRQEAYASQKSEQSPTSEKSGTPEPANRGERPEELERKPTGSGIGTRPDAREGIQQPKAGNSPSPLEVPSSRKSSAEQPAKAHRIECRQDLSPRERAERSRIHAPANGVGFGFDSRKLVPGSMEAWLSKLPPDQRVALRDPNARVKIEGLASRPGPDDYNKKLGYDRATAVGQWLVDHGVRAEPMIYNPGEGPAKEAHKPEKVDDATDRIAKIEVIPATKNISPEKGLSPKDGVRTIMDNVYKPPQEDKFRTYAGEQAKIVGGAIKDTLKSGPGEAIAKAAAKEARWMAKQVFADLKEADIRYGISTDTIRAFIAKIDELTRVGKYEFSQSPINWKGGSRFIEFGEEIAKQAYDNLTPEQQSDLTNLMHSDQREQFEKDLRNKMYELYISEKVKYGER